MINYRPLEQVKAEDFESAPELQEYTYLIDALKAPFFRYGDESAQNICNLLNTIL